MHFQKIQQLLILLLLMAISACHFGKIPKERRVYAIGEIAEVFPGKRKSCDVIFYDSLMNKHRAHYPDMIEKLRVGENYKIAYDKNDISNIDIFFTAPVIADSLDFYQGHAMVLSSVFQSFYESNYCSYNYNYNGNRYNRYQYVVGKNLKIGDSIEVLINKKNPKIAYVKGSSAITN